MFVVVTGIDRFLDFAELFLYFLWLDIMFCVPCVCDINDTIHVQVTSKVHKLYDIQYNKTVMVERRFYISQIFSIVIS